MRRLAVDGATLAYLVDEPAALSRGAVLLAHGFPDGPRSFDALVPALLAGGLSVVRPWMRGYAPSSLADDGRYDVAALGADLVALAGAVSPARPLVLVGHDWGAVAAYVAAAMAPSRFSRLVTLAVPHPLDFLAGLARPRQLARSWYLALFQLPRLAEAVLRADDFALVARLWRRWSPGYHASPAQLRAICDAFRAPARTRAVIDYYRAARRLDRAQEIFSLLRAPLALPVTYLHGADDGCIGVELARAGRLPAQVVTDAGHFLQLERPDVIIDAILDRDSAKSASAALCT